MTLSQDFYAYLCQKYPKLQGEVTESSIAPNLLSPHKVELSLKHKESIESTIRAFQALRDFKKYQNWIDEKWHNQFNPGNNSLFMSYDFHVTAGDEIKLIEINTNASFLGLGFEMNQFHKIPWNADFKLADLKECFLSELKLAGYAKPLKKIVIIDDHPKDQKLFLEFILYQEFFKTLGFDCEIADLSETEKLLSADLIYNRSTDFYFEEEKSSDLKKIFLSKQKVVSPNPYEYRLLADKENFTEWNHSEFWSRLDFDHELQKTIQKVLPKTQIVSQLNRETIWSNRKNLFFKPKRAFGSKSAFKGASIARKAFEDLVQQQALAQEFIPPSELQLDTPAGLQNFKYDLRCYAYRDKFQGCVARIYQGQVTNLRTEGGGFAPVIFN